LCGRLALILATPDPGSSAIRVLTSDRQLCTV